jgi:hypothetical protein
VTSAARERLAEHVGQESIVVPPASKISGAAASPKCSTPSVTPLASTVVMRPAPAPWCRRACGAEEPCECIVDLQDCGTASIDRPNASNSSPVRHDRSSAAARREDLLGGRHTDVRRSCPRLLEAGSAHRNTSGVVLTGDDQSAVGRSFARRARRGPRARPTTDSPDEFRAQCPANAATTGASVSAEPAPMTK